MKLLFENFRMFINEETRDTYGSEVEDRYARSRKASIYEENDKVSPDQAIADEGGALGFSKWEELTSMSREELEKYVKDNDNIQIHKHGDIIDKKGLNEDVDITEDIVIDEDKICQKGKNWAMEKYKKWSAYAAMGASKYCKDPNYGKGKKKKNESLEEDCQDGYERVPGSTEFAPGSCEKKGSAKKEGMKIEEVGALKKWRDANWRQSDGTPCGDSKAQKNPKRCKPAAKWAKMSKSEIDADNAKKRAGGKAGEQFVAATKKGKVKGYSENMKITKSQLQEIIVEELEAVVSEQDFYEVDAKSVNEEYCPACRKLQEAASGELMFDPSIGTAMQKQLDKLEREKKEQRNKKRTEKRLQNLKDNPSLKLALKKSRDEEGYFSLEEKKRKKPCKKAKGKKFVKRVNGRCRSFGQAGKAKGGGPRIRPGTAKGNAYCARSAGIKKCKNPPCANTLSRRKWKCRGKRSVAEE